MTTDRQLGMRLRELRERHDLSQRELAHRLGVSRSLVTRWETGLRPLSIVDAANLAKALHIEPAAFVDFVDRR